MKESLVPAKRKDEERAVSVVELMPSYTPMRELLVLTTCEDASGYKFYRREDTGRAVRGLDIEVLEKPMNPRAPVILENAKRPWYERQTHLSFPESVVPKRANAVAFLDEKIRDEVSIQRLSFCRIRRNPDDEELFPVYTLIGRKLYG